ncbi:endonuclease/exonuclease/phosphatase family protein [Streptomyces sp. NPDC048389]|uniref:endonuclease/exonuclease/phosphatase family protein n=1 Tax=Streptomyces sp. NPDC048389 TaxID=3154622 RepID=UPI003451CB9E
MLCAAVAALLVSSPFSPVTGPPQPNAEYIGVLNWNICGEAGGRRGERGYCPHRNRPGLKVAEIRKMVDERATDVVMLQEVCGGAPGSHLALLETALGSGWEVVWARGSRPDGSTSCRKPLVGELGVAVAVRGRIASSASTNTLAPHRTPSGRERLSPLLCVDVETWSHRMCTTHLLPSGDRRGAAQAAQIAARVAPDGKPYVLAGDFNRNSHSAELRPLTENLTECQDLTRKGGRATHHAWNTRTGEHEFRTLDHVFVSPDAAGSPAEFASCRVDMARLDTTRNVKETSPNGFSDHAPLHVDVRIDR